MAKKKSSKISRYRDAGTGHYTSKKEAEKRPKETVKETDRRK